MMSSHNPQLLKGLDHRHQGHTAWCMRRPVLLLTLLIISAVTATRAAEDKTYQTLANIEIHAGVINEIVTTVGTVDWLRLDKLLEEAALAPDTSVETARAERQPGDGRMFVIIQVSLAEGTSIGKYDYVLRIDDEVARCQGLARAGGFFDPRLWEVKHDEITGPVRLLYEVPVMEDSGNAVLEPRLDLTIPLSSVEITINLPEALRSEP